MLAVLVLYLPFAALTWLVIYASHLTEAQSRQDRLALLLGSLVVAAWWPVLIALLLVAASALLLRAILSER